ncbi:TetR/AcrR family transcriptional regulator [Novosphingobium sp. M1R2S20]|uniref:TetR/AcrR family transcriptional regulator n=1 Tax=Novosphingobium rhizovicinum TaxID=3228928 RepID=A0ABV3RCW5_9SPHN
MTRRGPSAGARRPSRARGRPTAGAAAQIDRDILEVARELFFVHGYARTSMAMIIEAAGVSKTTLYARYATKAELFRATVLLTIERIANGTLSTAESRTQDLVRGLEIFGCDALKISLSPLWSSYERLLFTEGPGFPELVDAVAERSDVGIQTVSRFIEACAARDGIPCRDPEGVAMVFIMALRGYYTAAMLRVRIPDSEECSAFVRRLVKTLVAGRYNW